MANRREQQVSDPRPSQLDREKKDKDRVPSDSHQHSSQSISVGAKTDSRSHNEALHSPKPFSDIKAIKKIKFDLYAFLKGINVFHYWGTGIAATEDGRILITLFLDKRVVVFSKHPVMRLLSCIKLPEAPRSIAVMNNTEAVVSTDKQFIAILGIAGPKLKIKNKVKLGYEISDIARHRDKLVVMCFNPIVVKLIDKSGTVYWSVSHDEQGHNLFATPTCNGVSCCSDDLSSSVIVSDHHTETLTLLNGDTGAVVTRTHVTGQSSFVETTDTTESVYFVCYGNRQQISAFNSDLSKERVILDAKDDMFHKPVSLTYDYVGRQLFVCYAYSSIFECFEFL